MVLLAGVGRSPSPGKLCLIGHDHEGDLQVAIVEIRNLWAFNIAPKRITLFDVAAKTPNPPPPR